jgi:hypothetical protein
MTKTKLLVLILTLDLGLIQHTQLGSEMEDKRKLECHSLILATLLFFNPQQAARSFDTPDLGPRTLKRKRTDSADSPFRACLSPDSIRGIFLNHSLRYARVQWRIDN